MMKISDARFRSELSMARRDFPFMLLDLQNEGDLNLDLIRHRASNQLFVVTQRAGEFFASNFDCASSEEATEIFNRLLDDFECFVFSIVDQMRKRTDELDNATRNGLETPVKRVVKAKRNRRRDGSDS